MDAQSQPQVLLMLEQLKRNARINKHQHFCAGERSHFHNNFFGAIAIVINVLLGSLLFVTVADELPTLAKWVGAFLAMIAAICGGIHTFFNFQVKRTGILAAVMLAACSMAYGVPLEGDTKRAFFEGAMSQAIKEGLPLLGASQPLLIAGLLDDLRQKVEKALENEAETSKKSTSEKRPASSPASTSAPGRADSNTEWRALKIGETWSGIAFRKVGKNGAAYVGGRLITSCSYNGGIDQRYARLYISPPSPRGQFFAVSCGGIDDGVVNNLALVNSRTGAILLPSPRQLFAPVEAWISFSPDERYAVLNQTGDEGNYSPLIIDLVRGLAKELRAPIIPHDAKWIDDRTVRYLANGICDGEVIDYGCNTSLGEYEFEVDVTLQKVRKKRIGNAHE